MSQESRSFCLWLAQVLLLLGLIGLLFWLSLRPKTPHYTIVNFNIQALNGKNTSAPSDNHGLNTTITFQLEIANPNKDSGIYYDTIDLTMFFKDTYIGSTTTDPFYQGRHRTDTLTERINAGRRFSKQGLWVAFNGATVQLKVHMATRVQYRIWGGKTKHHRLELQGCVPVGPDGKIKGKKKVKLRHSTKGR